MEKKPIVHCDTNILIEFYKNNATILSQLRSIGQENIAVSIVTAGELLYGALNKNELKVIKNNLSNLLVLYRRVSRKLFPRFNVQIHT